MIWMLGGLLGLAVSLYLVAPFLSRDIKPATSEELSTYKAELKAIEQSEEPEAAKRAIIQARLIRAAKTSHPSLSSPLKWLAALVGAGILIIGTTIYWNVGSPNFIPETRQAAPTLADNESSQFQDLLPRFEALLAENPEDARAWALYGRTLMLSGNTEAGLLAYERSLSLQDTPELRKEYEAAKTFATQIETGPRAEDIAAMQSLSEAERRAAIEGMVESLRSKLEENPVDTDGWVRLLRSRKVLGQIQAGEADIAALRVALPEQADAIISKSGWQE